MYHLTQVNIARMVAPLSDPRMAGFVAKLDEVNALADASQGFIWRFQTPAGNAIAMRAYEDDRILFNLSVWTSLAAFTHFVYARESAHRHVLQQRRRWFERLDAAYQALWWIPQGHLPTVGEARERLEYLRLHGESAFAFSLKTPFPAPDAEDGGLLSSLEERSPGKVSLAKRDACGCWSILHRRPGCFPISTTC